MPAVTSRLAATACCLLLTAAAGAAPYTPTADSQVLATVPARASDPRARELYTRACEGQHMRGCSELAVMFVNGEGGPREGDLDLQWRKTWRTGRVKLINVREAPFGDFEHGDAAFRILIDYPWDVVGFSAENDRQAALDARTASRR